MNIRPSHVLIVGAISILALTGCNNTTTTQSSPGENNASPVATSTSSTTYPGLLAVISSTKASIEAGDYTKAKTEFAKFEDNWKPVEDGIKAKSSDSYSAIEDSLDKINGELNASQPNKDKVLADLQLMETNINNVSK